MLVQTLLKVTEVLTGKAEFVRVLTFSRASCLEIIGHVEKTNRLYKEVISNNEELIQQYRVELENL